MSCSWKTFYTLKLGVETQLDWEAVLVEVWSPGLGVRQNWFQILYPIFFFFSLSMFLGVYIISSQDCGKSELPNTLSNTEQAWEMVAITHHC